ncbi:MAG: MBL fold metallo-hydrolase [Eubacterium sp.]|nr:MBL fold metallo-hydrolase [Eubacterium sp.]
MSKIIQYLCGMSNGYILKCKEGYIAIDCGSEYDISIFKNVLSENNINPEEIKLIIVTHGHCDHFVNADEMKKLTGAPLLCHKEAVLSLTTPLYPDVHARNEVGYKLLNEMTPDGEPCPILPPVTPDIVIGNEDYDLSDYGIDAKIIYTPGHSLGCISIITGEREAFVGDILQEKVPGCGSPPGVAYFTYTDDLEEANKLTFASCDRLLKEADIFYSGHSGPFIRQEIQKCIDDAKEEAKTFKL